MAIKRVLTYGTFDLLHYGHIRLLQRAAALGDYLIVALSTDEFNALKGKASFYPYEVRKEMLEAIRYVDLVIPEDSWEQKAEDVREYHVDTVVMGGAIGLAAIASSFYVMSASWFIWIELRGFLPRRSKKACALRMRNRSFHVRSFAGSVSRPIAISCSA